MSASAHSAQTLSSRHLYILTSFSPSCSPSC
jgi:hypothetical protein